MEAQGGDSALERAWLQRIGCGDRAAFEAFFRAYERRVYRYAVRLVADDDVASQVAADVMFEVWRCAAKYAGRSEPSTWVLGIAHHKALDALRRSRGTLVELRVAEPLAAEADEPERRAIASSARAELETALGRLSPEHRSVLHLTFVLGYSQSEVAAIVGCPLGTVKTRVHHAKRALRTTLAAAGHQREVS